MDFALQQDNDYFCIPYNNPSLAVKRQTNEMPQPADSCKSSARNKQITVWQMQLESVL